MKLSTLSCSSFTTTKAVRNPGVMFNHRLLFPDHVSVSRSSCLALSSIIEIRPHLRPNLVCHPAPGPGQGYVEPLFMHSETFTDGPECNGASGLWWAHVAAAHWPPLTTRAPRNQINVTNAHLQSDFWVCTLSEWTQSFGVMLCLGF